MLHGYNSYVLILENAREKKIEKVIEKIKKFANIPEIYNWAIDKCTNDRKSTEGLQYAVWVANQLKNEIVKKISEYFKTDKDLINELIRKGDKDKITEIISSFWKNFHGMIEGYSNGINEEINYILDWFKSPIRTEKVNLSELDLESAYKKSNEWHKSLTATGKIEDETGKVFIEFDDGYYWIDLQTTYSEDEAKAMGHCGNTNDGDTLFSLRDKNKSPHITVAYDSKDGCIYQMKGRNNTKPIDKYHPYIYRLLVDPTLKPKYFGYEWNKKEDFNLSDFDRETFDKAFKYNPNLIYDSIEHDHKMCRGLIKKGYLEKDEVKNILLKSSNVRLEIIMDLCDTGIFEKDEMKDLIKISNITPDRSSDLVVLKLYDNGFFNDEDLTKKFSELVFENGELYLDADSDDIKRFASDVIIDILFGDDPFGNWDYGWYDMESSDQVWDDLTKENKEKVIDKIIENIVDGLNYYYYRTDKKHWFTKIKPTREMFKWIENTNGKGEYYFVYNDYNYDIDILIDENKKGDTKEIYTALNRSLLSAQRAADENEYYKMCKKAIKNEVGEFERKSKEYLINGKKRYQEVFRFKAHDVCDWTDMVSNLENAYSWHGDIDWNESSCDSIWCILNEMDKFSKVTINDDYGVYGTIDEEYLNQMVDEDLRNI